MMDAGRQERNRGVHVVVFYEVLSMLATAHLSVMGALVPPVPSPLLERPASHRSQHILLLPSQVLHISLSPRTAAVHM